ncbi:MAG TPA: tryptophan--tRNA ligase [Caldisericia bacterium]|nr:tryptophan--tRNA ligase [Caldisericia bacterium]
MKRIASGMRPTGKLHLGNYFGALKNWIELQDEYECFYFIADYHALTTKFEASKEIRNNIYEMALDWFSMGLDYNRSLIYLQSSMIEIPILHLIFSMIVPMPWLERNPTVKEMIRDLDLKENVGYGLLGYPVLQSADILIVKGEYVPVGKDQLPHLEFARELARRFNYIYGEYFPEPEPIFTETPIIYGTDGKKMSKSLNNQINLSDSKEIMIEKISQMVTDPSKIRKNDPGHPDICSVFTYYGYFDKENEENVKKECQNGERGCVQCKKEIALKIYNMFEDYREKKTELEKDKDTIWDILREGNKKAEKFTKETIEEVKKLMGLNYK